MNRSLIVAVLTVTMIIMMSAVSYAIEPHSFTCENCHGKFPSANAAGSALQSAVACLGCHNSTAEASRMPINAGSMSNYFGTVAGQPAKGSRSSHTWNAVASYQNYSVSMVQEPLNTALNSGNGGALFTKTVVCIRCHDPYHGAGTNSIPDVDKPFLRATNVNDSLCLDCHRARLTPTGTAVTGSHPVSYRAYSTVYKSNTTAFRKVPLSPNPNNPTSKLGNYLKSGKIVCSTCHATHYGDSNSATLDNRSTANGFAQDDPAKGLKGQMQDSKGLLLRTDEFGATADAINICSSCHKESKNSNHNGRGQNIQCDNCHGAHVDFTGDNSAKNLNLVRRDFSNMSTAKLKLGSNVKVIYNTATSLRFVRSDNKGICQVCHAPTHAVDADSRKGNCLVCHTHANGFSAVSCNSCHGYPPTTSNVGGPNGMSSKNYTLDESFTPHATHADAGYYKYSCKNCHYDGTRQDSHNTLTSTGTATFSSVFVDTAGSVGTVAGFPNIPSHYNAGTKTCSNVYCHSNGNPRALVGNVISWKSTETPSWINGKGKILGTSSECITCHDSSSALSPINTNAHYAHVKTNSIKCYVCHADTVTGNMAILDRTKHANGEKNVSFPARPENYKSVFTAAFNSTDATCTNSCHVNELGQNPSTPAKWTVASTGACGTCHAAVPNSSLHGSHFTGTTGPKLGLNPDCSSCHAYGAGAITHANGVVDLKAGNSCAPCHPDTAVSPIWATNSKVTCESCHTVKASVVLSQTVTYTAPLKGLNGHSQYSSAALTHVKCTTCHSSTANHIGAGPTEKRLNIAGNGTCDSCHLSTSGKGLPTARVDLLGHTVSTLASGKNKFMTYSTLSDGRAKDCAGCHDTHGTSNLNSIKTTINGQTIAYTNTSTGFFVTKKNGNGVFNGLCQVCHTKTKHFSNWTTPVLSNHYMGNCLDCHKHKGAGLIFAFQGSGDCSTCHGYPPVKSLSGIAVSNNYTSAKIEYNVGSGGAHSVAGHISKTAKVSETWSNCSNCHYNTDHNTGGTPVNPALVNVIVDPKFKFNNASTITYKANNCSNVSCHFKPSPNWKTGL